MHPTGNGLEPLGTVIHRVQRRDVCQKDLGRADIAGGLFPPDVLLAGLQRHPECGPPLSIFGYPDDAPRY